MKFRINSRLRFARSLLAKVCKRTRNAASPPATLKPDSRSLERGWKEREKEGKKDRYVSRKKEGKEREEDKKKDGRKKEEWMVRKPEK